MLDSWIGILEVMTRPGSQRSMSERSKKEAMAVQSEVGKESRGGCPETFGHERRTKNW